MELTKSFTDDRFAQALDSWGWLDLAGLTPIFASMFGDVFFSAADGCRYLDAREGTLRPIAANREELDAILASEDGRERYLLRGLAAEALDRGIVPGPDEIYDFRTPIALGGELAVSNVTATDFVVALDLAGQIHGQIRDLPAGTSIDNVEIN